MNRRQLLASFILPSLFPHATAWSKVLADENSRGTARRGVTFIAPPALRLLPPPPSRPVAIAFSRNGSHIALACANHIQGHSLFLLDINAATDYSLLAHLPHTLDVHSLSWESTEQERLLISVREVSVGTDTFTTALYVADTNGGSPPIRFQLWQELNPIDKSGQWFRTAWLSDNLVVGSKEFSPTLYLYSLNDKQLKPLSVPRHIIPTDAAPLWRQPFIIDGDQVGIISTSNDGVLVVRNGGTSLHFEPLHMSLAVDDPGSVMWMLLSNSSCYLGMARADGPRNQQWIGTFLPRNSDGDLIRLPAISPFALPSTRGRVFRVPLALSLSGKALVLLEYEVASGRPEKAIEEDMRLVLVSVE